MRLIKILDDRKWSLTPDLPASPAPYAILSHTWGADEEEINFKDIQGGFDVDKAGFDKLWFCADQARRDGLEYFWIDTCCIDKTNHVELSEAITSMFRWYRQAAKCYVYLSDVSAASENAESAREEWEHAFRNSRWFTRGWTLQELLAPTTVEFFSREHRRLGSKKTLESLIHETTQVPVDALRGQPLSRFAIDERLKWTRGRQTRKVEDRAYCLLGIFDVSMSLRYGEGEQALARLEKKVKGLSKSAESPEFINWLAPSRPLELHAKIAKSRQPGTGLDFTTGPLVSWLEAESGRGSLIWITGKSGTGKTTLFSHTVDATEAFMFERPNMAFAYHYCTFSNPESQQLINVLGSLVVQMSAWQPSVLEEVKPVFLRDRERKQVKTLQVLELERILVKYGSRCGKVVLLIDALNESEDPVETCACIGRLLQQLPSLKVLMTSTRSVSMPDAGGAISLSHIQMNPLGDILTFVDSRLDTHAALRYLSDECKSAIRTTLIGRADSSFRWVSLVLDSLGRERTERAVLKVLTHVPGDLHDTYAGMLDSIPRSDVTIAREVLLWVCFAVRPITLRELSEAAILDDCGKMLNPRARLFRPEIILEICHGFLDYNDSSGVVKLAHASVKDCLLSQRFKNTGNAFSDFSIEHGHRSLMMRCLTYLTLNNFRTGAGRGSAEVDRLLQEFPLLSYAAHYWGLHAAYATESEWKLAEELFSTRTLPGGGNYSVWGSCVMPNWLNETVTTTEPLYYAASLGMESVVQALLSGVLPSEGSKSLNIEATGGRFGSTALQVACFRARKRSARHLVAAGADFWSKDPGSGRPAWFWAKCNDWGDAVDDMKRRKPGLAKYMDAESDHIARARDFQQWFVRK